MATEKSTAVAENEVTTAVADTENEVTTAVVEEPTTPVELNTQEEKIDAYFKYTGLKLDTNCHMDMEYLNLWYVEKYLTGKVYKWAMKPGARIVHYADGVIYKSANMTDEIAERLMKENPAYAEQFVNILEKK